LQTADFSKVICDLGALAVALVLADVTDGMTDASATRRPVTPRRHNFRNLHHGSDHLGASHPRRLLEPVAQVFISRGDDTDPEQ
jgi:hypothetical protein